MAAHNLRGLFIQDTDSERGSNKYPPDLRELRLVRNIDRDRSSLVSHPSPDYPSGLALSATS